MVCERPGGPIVDAVRDSMIKFPPNFEGDLPPVMTRDELRTQMEPVIKERDLTKTQIEELLDFLEKYKERYYESLGGKTYHRPCSGGAMVQGETGIFCAKCGRLPDLLPPSFMR